ncbi:MAG: YciI family protein [Rhodanobacter sp.]
MRFMLLMIPAGYENAAPGTLPNRAAMAAMMKFNQSMQNAGVLLTADGLHPPSMGARVTFVGGTPKIVAAPFPGVKEVLGGYWIIQVNSKQEAIDWASRCPASANETIEIRQIQEAEDFES